MELISMRLDRDKVERLKTLARMEAARRDESVTWAQLVRECIERLLKERGLSGAPAA